MLPWRKQPGGETQMAKNWGRPLVSSEKGTEALNPTTHEEQNHINNHMNLEWDPYPVEPSNETPALADTLIAALWKTLKQRTQLSYIQIPNSQKLRDNECVLLLATKFMVIFMQW